MRKISKAIRVDSETFDKITYAQSILGLTKKAVVRKAVDRLNRDLLFDQINASYKRLKKDKKAWAEELRERKEWGI